jgi:hypothetical protein
VVSRDPVTNVPLCEHGDDAAACQLAHHDDLGPSPAELGDTITVATGEWTPLDDEGTQIYLYGDHPVTLAVQTAEVADEARQLRAEVERLHEQLNGRARNEARLVNAFEALTTDAEGRDLDATEALVVGRVRRAFAEVTTVTRPDPSGGAE